MSTTTLYRPVGLAELALMYDLRMREFPPRLPDQPIFYPVLNREYAVQIARDWNTPSEQSGYCGYGTRFAVDAGYLKRYEEQVVGSQLHRELWIPAEELEEFNRHLNGPILVTDAFFGPNYTGYIPAAYGLAGKTAFDQFVSLAKTLDYSGMDFIGETSDPNTSRSRDGNCS